MKNVIEQFNLSKPFPQRTLIKVYSFKYSKEKSSGRGYVSIKMVLWYRPTGDVSIKYSFRIIQ